ncbi:MAG: hypothetical protein J5I94_22210, partial [Phaeodactylibacter sp.]|nr:hypothetical protein [Phaeodactylibacter sp.]
MKKMHTFPEHPALLLGLFSFFILFLPPQLQAQDWQQARRFSASGSNRLSNTAVASAPDGSIYLAGSLKGTVTFDHITVSAPSDQGFLARLSRNFEVLWVHAFPEKAYDLATDALGHVFLAGSQNNDTLSYVAKYDSNGLLLNTFLSEGGRSQARTIRTDADGNVYVAGWMTDTTSFGNITLDLSGSVDSYLMRLGPALSQVSWAVQGGLSSRRDLSYGLVVDSEGNVYFGGNYSQSHNIFCFCWSGSFFVEKRSGADGALIWNKVLSGGSGSSTRLYVEISEDETTLFASASFKNTVNFGNGLSLTTGGGTDDYHLFVAELGADNGEVISAVKVTQAGDGYVTGIKRFGQKLHLLGYFLSPVLVGADIFFPAQGAEALYIQVDPQGLSVESAEAFSGSGSEYGYDIDIGNSLVISGRSTTSGALSLGPFSLSGTSYSLFVASSQPLCVPGFATVAAEGPLCAGDPLYLLSEGADNYSWTGPNGFASSAQNPVIPEPGTEAAGLYTLIATDANGCRDILHIDVAVPEPLSISPAGPQPIACPGSSNGQAVALAVGGTSPYTYLWSNGQSGPSAAGLATGDYFVTATDSNGCEAAISIYVAESEPLVLDSAILQNPACSSSADGQIALDVSGGMAPLTYIWSNGQEGPLSTGLNAGLHFVTVTDAAGCSLVDSFSLQAPYQFMIGINLLRQVMCRGDSTATIRAIPIGGIGPFNYLWDTGQTSDEVANLPAGNYSVTITDANGCTTNGGVTVPDPPTLEVNL